MEKTMNVCLFLCIFTFYYENEKGKLNMVILIISILKTFFTIVRDDKIATHFFREVK